LLLLLLVLTKLQQPQWLLAIMVGLARLQSKKLKM
jgi:hypothetical protein